jgi:hypothetical protein
LLGAANTRPNALAAARSERSCMVCVLVLEMSKKIVV